MAKKKVVKHSSSKTPKEQVVDTSIEQPIVEQKVAQTPKPIEQPKPVVQSPKPVVTPQSTNTDKDSIYADDTPKKTQFDNTPKETTIKIEVNVNPDEKKYGVFNIIMTILTGMIILVWVIILASSIQRDIIVNNVTRNITTYESIPAKINLAEYTNITNLRYTEKVTLLGYLRLDTMQVDKTTKIESRTLVDDYGKSIALNLGYGGDKYKPLFINNYTTTNLFEVTGTFKYTYSGYRNGFLIDIATITAKSNATRPTILTAVNKTVVDQLPPETKYSFNFTRGWTKVTGWAK